jgi:hypothetical protein
MEDSILPKGKIYKLFENVPDCIAILQINVVRRKSKPNIPLPKLSLFPGNLGQRTRYVFYKTTRAPPSIMYMIGDIRGYIIYKNDRNAKSIFSQYTSTRSETIKASFGILTIDYINDKYNISFSDINYAYVYENQAENGIKTGGFTADLIYVGEYPTGQPTVQPTDEGPPSPVPDKLNMTV